MSGAGVAFSWSDDGDMRADPGARRRLADRLGIPAEWATVRQVHGGRTVTVAGPGEAGEADSLVSFRPGVPLAVFTADCLGIVIAGEGGVAVVHAGWRGLLAGVIESALDALRREGVEPGQAWIGPSIGPCCFEVGGEVATRFEAEVTTTSWGTQSVDLAGAARRRLAGLEVKVDGRCTRCRGGFSHRGDGTPHRQAAIGWLEVG